MAGMIPTEQITAEVTSWPGVEAGTGPRGEFGYKFRGREIAHVHGERTVHFAFPKEVAAELREQGRIGPHPAFPDKIAWGARHVETDDDLRDAIALIRLNYDRAVERFGASDAA